MARYDGLIIPRSYSEYINKTDAATLLQALQLSGVMDNAPTSGSNHPTKSSGVYTALAGKQATLTFDNAPTQNSNNPVKSGGIFSALKNIYGNIVLAQFPPPGTSEPTTWEIEAIGTASQYTILLFANFGQTEPQLYTLKLADSALLNKINNNSTSQNYITLVSSSAKKCRLATTQGWVGVLALPLSIDIEQLKVTQV